MANKDTLVYKHLKKIKDYLTGDIEIFVAASIEAERLEKKNRNHSLHHV